MGGEPMFYRLRELRIDNDMSQYDIAKHLNMSQTGYSKYETGEVPPSVHAIIKLAKLYKTSTDYILGLTDETRPYK